MRLLLDALDMTVGQVVSWQIIFNCLIDLAWKIAIVVLLWKIVKALRERYSD